MTVKEYAESKGVSVQSVYGRINRGTLQVKTVNGVSHIMEDDSTLNPLNGTMNVNCIEELNKMRKKLDKVSRKHMKAVHRLELAEVRLKSMDTVHHIKDEEIATLKKSLDSYERLLGKGLIAHNDVIDVAMAEDITKPKKKKKKK